MEVFFNAVKGKASRLVDALYSNIDGRKRYQLSIFTCYLADAKNLSKIHSFIQEVANNIKLIDVRLYVDARECIRVGLDDLRDFQESYLDDDISLEIIAIDTPTLFHSKAYALLSYDERSGVLAVGSANFSNAGLFAKSRGNYETLLLTNEVETVLEFLSLQDINEKYFKTLDGLEEFKSENFSFKYSLLQQGEFVHKWNETLNQYFSIRYKLSEKGKSEIGNDVLKALDFSVDAETISRQFFDFSNIRKNDDVHLEQFNRLLKRGIETYLGYWLPLPLLTGMDQEYDADTIFEIISRNIEQQLIELSPKIVETFERLKLEGFIVEIDYDKDPVQELQGKLQQLKENPDKLYRLWHKFYKFKCTSSNLI